MQGLCWLHEKLIKDCRALKLPIDEVGFLLKPYSSSVLGRYFPVGYKDRVVADIYIYAYADKQETVLFDYGLLLTSLIHELVHHIQYSDPTFKRGKLMHDPKFWELYNHYKEKAMKMGLLDEDFIEYKERLIS